MNRNQIANVVAFIIAAAILVAAWFVSPSGIWTAVFGGLLAGILSLPIVKTLEKYHDERFTQILNLSARNGCVFLLFALPWTGALIALNVLIVDAIAAVLSLWLSSIAVMYVSGVYYFRK